MSAGEATGVEATDVEAAGVEPGVEAPVSRPRCRGPRCRGPGVEALVSSEVLTGFGRTGKLFGHQHWGVTPDIITCAKGMTSGYQPLRALIVHDRVARHFDENLLACGLTYDAHPGVEPGAAHCADPSPPVARNACGAERRSCRRWRARSSILLDGNEWQVYIGSRFCLTTCLSVIASHWIPRA
jgi:hypothetical protein